jgi:enoyl-[acyl-carrier protein] reductase III
MIDLTGRVALITGSSRGLGRACAVRLAEAGADVIVNYVTSRTAADEVAREVQAFGRRTAVVKADVSQQDDVMSLMDFVRDHFGSLDILVSNAASGGFRSLMASSALNFEATMNTNVRALMFLVQAASPLMEQSAGRAKVIALSSHGAAFALPFYGLIGASKAALEALVRHFALELGGVGINFNIVQAGLLDTDASRQIPNFDELARMAQSKSMVGERRMELRDAADVVLFLASPLSDLIQGQTIVVDGGASTRA